MNNIMQKELRLSASPLSYFFTIAGLMFFIPGYPILCGAFFTTLGLFYSFQAAREANDIVFSALLPIAKKDVVKGKFLFVCLIEAAAFVLMIIGVLVRMTLLKDASVYRNNALMNANLFALGAALVVFGLFNLIFVAGFFKTAYKFARPFITYIIVGFIVIFIVETLHHVPGLEALNSFGTDHLALQLITLIAGALIFTILTIISLRISCRRFEQIDL